MSLLPYAWAKAQRALLRPGEHGATLLVSPRTPGWAISEVRQRHAPASLESVRDDELEALTAQLDELRIHLEAAELRLDCVRVIWVSG